MRKVLCCSTLADFQGLPAELLKQLKDRNNVQGVIYQTIAIDKEFRFGIDWGKMKKEEGVVMVILCDNPARNILGTFFREVIFTAELPVHWYSSRDGGRENWSTIRVEWNSDFTGW